jgi:hypothetical protein
MTDSQISLLESLETQQAFNKESAVLFGMIKDHAKLPVTAAELTWCRNTKLIKYKKNGYLTYYFLSDKGFKLLADSATNQTAKCTDESKQNQENKPIENNNVKHVNDIDVIESQLIDLNMDDSMLNDVALPEAPEYDPEVVANQHTDAFINATNESKKPIEIVEFIVIDQHGDMTHDGFETITDTINKAHELAAVGGEYHVERIAARYMGSVKPAITTKWVAA